MRGLFNVDADGETPRASSDTRGDQVSRANKSRANICKVDADGETQRVSSETRGGEESRANICNVDADGET